MNVLEAEARESSGRPVRIMIMARRCSGTECEGRCRCRTQGPIELTDERDECCRRGPAAIGSGGGGAPLPKGVAIIECALGAAAWPDLGCSDGIAAAQDTVEADRILSAA